MTKSEHRSGFVAVVGKPNVGKSTLINALVGHKISIVTSKPHTTRHAILGVLTKPEAQIVFIDTPGLENKSRRLMNRAMNRAAVGAIEGANVILFVVEAGKWASGDEQALKLIRQSGLPCMLVINKVDQVKPKEKLLPYLQALISLSCAYHVSSLPGRSQILPFTTVFHVWSTGSLCWGGRRRMFLCA